MINANNEIIYGDYGANEGIVEMMSQYLSDPSAPAPGVLDLYQDGFEKIGRCGDDVIWRFYPDGTLRLSGKGYTWDNFWSPTGIGWMGENDDEWGDNYSPTYIYCNDVKKIIVDEEVGILGGNLFNGFGNVESITFLNHGPDLDAPSCDGGYKSVKKMYSSYCVMPYISDENRKVNVYYPESDPTWTPEVLKALGRYNTCRWIPVDENGVHHHEWGDWVITKAGTYQQEGVKERVCTKCGEKETAKISRQDCRHKWGDWVITQAQLLKEGGTKRRDCTICGKRETASITEKDFIAGKCGDEAVWRFYKSGILRIDGKGDLWGNFYSPSAIGWLNEGETREDTYSKTYIDSKNIKKVVVGRQIGRIGGSMFSNCVNLKQIRFLCKAPKLSVSPVEEPQFKTVRDLYKGYPPFPYGKSITIQYPKDDTSWTAAMRSFLQSVDAGTIKWVPVDQNGKHTHSWNAWKTTKAATVKAVGTKARTCAACGDKQTAEIPRLKSIVKAAVSGVKAKVWTGKAQTQDITVKLGNKTLKKGTDYTVSYTANKNVGKATLAVTGKGSYQGTVKKTFAINPKGTDLTKINAGSRQFTVNWKKQTSQTTGYQIQYSTSSTFKTDNKTETISDRSTVSKTVAGLTKGKTYYVRIRTYKTVGNSRYYSAWSSALSMKITK